MDCKHERQARLDQWIEDVKGDACAFCLQAEVEKLKAKNVSVQEQLQITATAAVDLTHERDKLKAEREDASALGDERIRKLEAEIQATKDFHESVLDEACNVYQKHCTCVPVLRLEQHKLMVENERLLNNPLDRQLYHMQDAQLAKLREALRAMKVDLDIRTDYSIHTLRSVMLENIDEALKGDSLTTKDDNQECGP